jgi:hypothetical protein
VSVPAPMSNEPVVEPTESKPAELASDVPPIAENAFPTEPESTTAELVIADLEAAKEAEPHAAELEVAPEPIEVVIVVLSAACCVFIRG